VVLAGRDYLLAASASTYSLCLLLLLLLLLAYVSSSSSICEYASIFRRRSVGTSRRVERGLDEFVHPVQNECVDPLKVYIYGHFWWQKRVKYSTSTFCRITLKKKNIRINYVVIIFVLEGFRR